jgi:hypothetical protein
MKASQSGENVTIKSLFLRLTNVASVNKCWEIF